MNAEVIRNRVLKAAYRYAEAVDGVIDFGSAIKSLHDLQMASTAYYELVKKDKNAKRTINFNGCVKEVPEQMSYDDVVKIAGYPDGSVITVTCHYEGQAGHSMIRGDTVVVSDGMSINAIDTGNA